jgi:uncharacterized protein (TIGR03067 family)
MLRVTALLVTVGLLGAADAPNKGAAAGKLEGTWKAVKGSDHGNPIEPAMFKMTLTLKGGKYSVKVNGMEVGSGTYTVDASKSPGHIDTTSGTGPDAGKVDLGIFELKGDALKTAFDKPGQKTRPGGFDGQKYEVIEFQRARE